MILPVWDAKRKDKESRSMKEEKNSKNPDKKQSIILLKITEIMKRH